MRSSVSVILSTPPPDTSMSFPDYSTHPRHHTTLLVLVRQVGSQLKSRSFAKLYERISRVEHIKVSDSNGVQRPVWVTYRRDYPIENNDWGDFQTHRRLLGIISIGQVESQKDLNEICKQHESLKVKYASTLYDSRCIILGLNPDGSIYDSESRSTSRSASPELSQSHDKQGPGPPLPGLTINGHTHHLKKVSSGSIDRDSGVYETVGTEDTPGETQEGGTISDGDNVTHVNGTSGGAGSDSGSESTSDRGELQEGEVLSNTSTLSQNARDSANNTKNASSTHSTNTKLDSPRDSAHDTSQSSLSSLASSSVSLQPPSNFKTRALFYPTGDHAVNIEAQLQEFVSSLFWVLESKRLDKSQEKLDKPPLMCAPFERKDFVGLDMDSRTNKKRSLGRLRKQLADLTLQAGLPGEAITHYSQAAETLRACNDWLWLAACYEGLCASSVVILYPNLRRGSLGLQRYSSLGVGGPAGGGGSGGGGGGGGKGKTGTINTNSLPTGLDPTAIKQAGKQCLTPEDIIEKYREAIVHFSKYRNAGVVETEASIKAVHVLIEQRRYLLAAEFLSNVVFINLQLSDEEKIARFNALADLYHQIGFHRKASFFRRVAAMRCVAPQNPEPDWAQCYRLLLHTLEGYKVSLDPLEYRKEGQLGWPALQIQILQELVGTSRRMGNNAVCTRHQAFLVCAMLPHLSTTEKQEMAAMLESVSSRCESGSTPLAVPDSGFIIPPVNLINVPHVKNVKVHSPSLDRRPEKRPVPSLVEEDTGPFIFSPFSSMNANNKPPGQMDFEWVEGEMCEVSVELANPMPFELKVASIALLIEGVPFESQPSSVVLPRECTGQRVTLRGRPQGCGEARVTGYTTSVLGVRSNCRFKYLSHMKIPHYIVPVVPALPYIQVCTDDGTQLCGEGENSNGVKLSLFAGEVKECSVVVHNTSIQPLQELEVTLDSRLEKDVLKEVFQYSRENLEAQLPIPPGGKASLTLYIYALRDFLAPGRLLEDSVENNSLVSGSEPPSLLSSGPSSLPSRHSIGPSSMPSSRTPSSIQGSRARRTDSSASLLSSRSGSSVRSGSSTSTQAAASKGRNTGGYSGALLEATLKLRYSGGEGLKGNYCRLAQVPLSVEVAPSLLVTRWDVLPAECASQCYLVLDLLNAAPHEMDLHYTPTKHLLIEAGDSCRVPIPLDRCPLSKINEALGEGSSSSSVASASAVLSAHVSSLVDLRWTLGPSESPAHAHLAGLTFTSHMHDLITMAPIQWEVRMDGEEVSGGAENLCIVGKVLMLSVGIRNASGTTLPPLSLRLTAYQDHQNGCLNYRLDPKMATTGATKVTIPQLWEGSEHVHECGLVFFTSGMYKVEVTCSPASGSNVSLYENVVAAHQHAWKFAPPLEITVTDS